MSSEFDILAGQAADDLDETFAQDLAYTAIGGDGEEVTLSGTFADEPADRQDGQDGQVHVQRAVSLVKQSELVQPAVGDLVEYRGQFWSVDSWQPAMGGSRWELKLVLATDLEKSRENFRIRRR